MITTVDEEMHQQFKQRAEQLDMSMSELLRALIQNNLDFDNSLGVDITSKTYGELRELIQNPPNEYLKFKAEQQLRRYL
ncbi:MAG: hypothetical protein R3321_00340 [Nitrososphaeraceae archaeon]|nr:hypothetical protein [Nitrososphaeraceae archaeon]